MSGFVSLTLTPMLCARVLRGHHEGEKQNVVLRMFEAMFKRWLRGYEWALDRVLAYKSITLLVTFAHHGRHGLALHRDPEGLLPDRGHRLHLGRPPKAPADISFDAMVERQTQDRRRSSGRIRRSTTSTRPSASAARTPPSTPAACSSR